MANRAALAMIALTGVLTACTGGSVYHVPVSGGVKGPGTAIGNGFTVASGSELEGIPFPGGKNASWTAVLKVTGDPVQVADAYLQQARAQRLGPTYALYPGGCDAQVETPDGVVTRALDSREGPARAVTCALVSQHLAWTFYLRTGRSVGDRGYSFAVMQMFLGHRHASGPTAGRPPLRAIAGTTPQIEPWHLPAIPGVGRRIDAGIAEAAMPRGVTVVPGSAMADVATTNEACAAGGFLAVLRVTGNPDAVLAAYAKQFTRNGFLTQNPTTTGQLRSTTSRTIDFSQAGGGDIAAELASTPAGDRWLLIQRCND